MYLKIAEARDVPAYTDEQADGALLMRSQNTDDPIGLTIVDWWKTYGHDKRPDSLRDIEEKTEPFSRKIVT